MKLTWYDRCGFALVLTLLMVPLALVLALVVSTFLRGPS